jgi:hypothetical protein
MMLTGQKLLMRDIVMTFSSEFTEVTKIYPLTHFKTMDVCKLLCISHVIRFNL